MLIKLTQYILWLLCTLLVGCGSRPSVFETHHGSYQYLTVTDLTKRSSYFTNSDVIYPLFDCSDKLHNCVWSTMGGAIITPTCAQWDQSSFDSRRSKYFVGRTNFLFKGETIPIWIFAKPQGDGDIHNVSLYNAKHGVVGLLFLPERVRENHVISSKLDSLDFSKTYTVAEDKGLFQCDF